MSPFVLFLAQMSWLNLELVLIPKSELIIRNLLTLDSILEYTPQKSQLDGIFHVEAIFKGFWFLYDIFFWCVKNKAHLGACRVNLIWVHWYKWGFPADISPGTNTTAGRWCIGASFKWEDWRVERQAKGNEEAGARDGRQQKWHARTSYRVMAAQPEA